MLAIQVMVRQGPVDASLIKNSTCRTCNASRHVVPCHTRWAIPKAVRPVACACMGAGAVEYLDGSVQVAQWCHKGGCHMPMSMQACFLNL